MCVFISSLYLVYASLSPKSWLCVLNVIFGKSCYSTHGLALAHPSPLSLACPLSLSLPPSLPLSSPCFCFLQPRAETLTVSRKLSAAVNHLFMILLVCVCDMLVFWPCVLCMSVSLCACVCLWLCHEH